MTACVDCVRSICVKFDVGSQKGVVDHLTRFSELVLVFGQSARDQGGPGARD